MSTTLTLLSEKLAARYGAEQSDDLIDVLKQTAFKGNVTNSQMTALLLVADQYGLNPWTKEIYAFPDRNNGIVPVVGVDGWSRIINEHNQFDGVEFEQTEESCTAIIYRKDRTHPIKITEWMSECRRADSPAWKSHPKRMLRHKSLIQCARLAFGFSGIYDQDEAEPLINFEAPEKIINPLPKDNIDVFSYENLLKKIEAHPTDNFDFFSVKQMRDAGFTQEQISLIRSACQHRRQELIDRSVVSTQTAQPQTAAPKNPSADKETDWVDITKNAESEQEIAAIAQSIPEDNIKAVIDGLTDSGKLQAFFLALTKEMQAKFNDDMDSAMDYLSSMAKGTK